MMDPCEHAEATMWLKISYNGIKCVIFLYHLFVVLEDEKTMLSECAIQCNATDVTKYNLVCIAYLLNLCKLGIF